MVMEGHTVVGQTRFAQSGIFTQASQGKKKKMPRVHERTLESVNAYIFTIVVTPGSRGWGKQMKIKNSTGSDVDHVVQQIRGPREGERGTPRATCEAMSGPSLQRVGRWWAWRFRGCDAPFWQTFWSLDASLLPFLLTRRAQLLQPPQPTSQKFVHGGEERERKKTEEEGTDEIFLASVKLLSIAIEPELLFAAHLKIQEERFEHTDGHGKEKKVVGRPRAHLGDLLAVQIVARLCERL